MPVLGDIPYLGALFRTTSDKRRRKELLILMTPVVMENSQKRMKLTDPEDVLQQNLHEFDLRPLMKQGEAQRKIVEPLYQTNRPSWRDQQLPQKKGPSQ